ncbi:ABC transporter ATP-binding protein [Thiosocius teredinicola]|uniref:ABC transporter ATP-binding protein n=1 Tax=Thiosocius teredinicola TaxID=1973002 RepID=UPI000990DEC3
MSTLRIKNLAGNGVNAGELNIGSGECVAVHGPSGAGKTLLLRAIADLDEAAGELWLNDQARSDMRAPEWRRQVMYVAAESAWWHELVRDHAEHWDSGVLQALGFTDEVLDWDVQRLSSGERQRLAIARALAHGPSVLLLDEATANLDQSNTARVEQLVDTWCKSTDGCVLWVSHDPAQRARIADRVMHIEQGVLRQGDVA